MRRSLLLGLTVASKAPPCRGCLSPGGAAVVSQGRKPLEFSCTNCVQPRRGGGHRRPSGAARSSTLASRGLRPWLTAVAPPGLRQARPCTTLAHAFGAALELA